MNYEELNKDLIGKLYVLGDAIVKANPSVESKDYKVENTPLELPELETVAARYAGEISNILPKTIGQIVELNNVRVTPRFRRISRSRRVPGTTGWCSREDGKMRGNILLISQEYMNMERGPQAFVHEATHASMLYDQYEEGDNRLACEIPHIMAERKVEEKMLADGLIDKPYMKLHRLHFLSGITPRELGSHNIGAIVTEKLSKQIVTKKDMDDLIKLTDDQSTNFRQKIELLGVLN